MSNFAGLGKKGFKNCTFWVSAYLAEVHAADMHSDVLSLLQHTVLGTFHAAFLLLEPMARDFP